MRVIVVACISLLASVAFADGLPQVGHHHATSVIPGPVGNTHTDQYQDAGFLGGHLLPVIRNADQLDNSPMNGKLARQPLAGDLVITYDLGFSTHAIAMTTDKVAQSGVALPTIHQIAINNLLEKSHQAVVTGSDEGLYFLALDGQSENALLLDHGLWQAVTGQIGPVIMSVPAPDMVLFVPQNDATALQIMLDVRDNVLSNRAQHLSKELFTWNNGSWVVLPDG